MAEAEKMADRVAILLSGKIVASGTPRELTASGTELTKIVVNTQNNTLDDNTLEFPGVIRRSSGEGYAVFFTEKPGPSVSAIIAFIEQNNDSLIDLRVVRPTLEERFLELTQSSNLEVNQ